jgi:hypothetical protein
VNYPLRLIVQPAGVTLQVQDANGAPLFHVVKQPDPAAPKEDQIVVSAAADPSRPLYTMTRAFPKWFHVFDAEGRDLCMVHERPAKEGPWGMDIYDVGDLVLVLGKADGAAPRAAGLGGLVKGLVARATPPPGYQVTTPDATPVLRLLPDGVPDQYAIERLSTVSAVNERRALITLLSVFLQPFPRPARRR